ncbi:unnamed protein product [Somion occarium]|uniref:Peptidase A1 domain-containing protein n=1 Tax=Somion occarium TaxID=3059160 RepID=A0ABP1D6Q1_9APHY
MFCKTYLFTVVLALFASASPLAEQRGEPIRIPLKKRSSLTNEDGTFNADKAILHNVKTQNKFRQNLINLERNKGREAFNEGAEIRPLALIPDRIRKRQKEALTDQQDDLEWTGRITIGSNNQAFVIDFDTGSSDLWVPNASHCTGCAQKHTYSSTSSSTSQAQNGTFSIQYGDGSTVSGPIFKDTVTVAGVKSTGQTFAAVTKMSSLFNDDALDGILGLAFQDISNLNAPPFYQNTFAESAVPENVFAFKLAESGSELFLGGTNSDLYSGDIEYHSVTSGGFWQATGGKAIVEGKTAVSGFQTIIDSGTTIMYGPSSAVETFYASVPGSKLFDSDNGFYSYPCASPPAVGFSWGGKTWTISADNFNLGQTESGSMASQCVGALAGQDIGLGDNVWLLGDSFMKNVYTAFNFDTKSVGFATLA